MKVKIKLFDGLEKYSNRKKVEDELDLGNDADIEDLLDFLSIPKHPKKIISVNSNIKDYSQKLNDGDNIQIFQSLDGG